MAIEQLINSLRPPTGTPDLVLDGAITNVQTTITVESSPGVPGNVVTLRPFRIRLDDEIMLATWTSGLTIAVVREYENAAQLPKTTHSDQTGIYIVPTASGLDQYIQEHGGVGGLLYLAANYT